MNTIGMRMLCLLSCVSSISTDYLGETAVQESKIIGGKDARIWNVPYLAAVEQGQKVFFGGAAIISFRWLCTVVHIFSRVKNVVKEMNVRIGASYLLRGGTTHFLIDYIPHPNYTSIADEPPKHNVALLKTKRGMIFDGRTRKYIPLVQLKYTPPFGTSMIVSGWGYKKNSGNISNVVQKATVTVVDDSICTVAYKSLAKAPYYVLPAGQFCANAKESATCAGDAGGPGVIDGKLAGLIVGGYNSMDTCERTDFPNILTKISYYVSWIKAKTNDRN